MMKKKINPIIVILIIVVFVFMARQRGFLGGMGGDYVKFRTNSLSYTAENCAIAYTNTCGNTLTSYGYGGYRATLSGVCSDLDIVGWVGPYITDVPGNMYDATSLKLYKDEDGIKAGGGSIDYYICGERSGGGYQAMFFLDSSSSGGSIDTSPTSINPPYEVSCETSCECTIGTCCSNGCNYDISTTICGLQDCDALDTICRNYNDVTIYCTGSNANCPASANCNSYTNTISGTSCGTGMECDGSGNCVPSGGDYVKFRTNDLDYGSGTIAFSTACDGTNLNQYAYESVGEWLANSCEEKFGTTIIANLPGNPHGGYPICISSVSLHLWGTKYRICCLKSATSITTSVYSNIVMGTESPTSINPSYEVSCVGQQNCATLKSTALNAITTWSGNPTTTNKNAALNAIVNWVNC